MKATAELIGRICNELELRYTPGGTAVLNFSLACDVGYGDNKQTSFIRCVSFGKQAENMAKYSGKGRLISVTGDIKTGSYEKDGRTVYTTDVQASRVIFLDWGDKGDGGFKEDDQGAFADDLDESEIPF